MTNTLNNEGGASNRAPRRRRGYSRDFKPRGDTGKRYLLDKIPAGLWSAVRAKCKREGLSVRAVVLGLLQGWVTDQLVLVRKNEGA